MEDADFEDLLNDYLDGTLFPNLEMADVEIVWVEGNPGLGVLHFAHHDVRKEEVEEVLLEIPPEVEPSNTRTIQDERFFGGRHATTVGYSSSAKIGLRMAFVT